MDKRASCTKHLTSMLRTYGMEMMLTSMVEILEKQIKEEADSKKPKDSGYLHLLVSDLSTTLQNYQDRYLEMEGFLDDDPGDVEESEEEEAEE